MNLELVIDTLGGLCPVQAEGRINDKQFYFRARGDAWSLGIADTVDEAIGNPTVEYVGVYGEVGGYEAGYLPDDEARAIIRCCAQQYVAARFARERQIGQWRAMEQQVVRSSGGITPELKALIDERVAALEADQEPAQRV